MFCSVSGHASWKFSGGNCIFVYLNKRLLFYLICQYVYDFQEELFSLLYNRVVIQCTKFTISWEKQNKQDSAMKKYIFSSENWGL